MKVLLSWSSGRDSAWALHLLNEAHPGSVGALLTTVNEAVDRVVRARLACVDPCGENGEFHTCVYAGPMFAQPLALDCGERVSREPFVWCDLVPS